MVVKRWDGKSSMSGWGQTEKSGRATGKLALPSITDIVRQARQVRKVPVTDDISIPVLISTGRHRNIGNSNLSRGVFVAQDAQDAAGRRVPKVQMSLFFEALERGNELIDTRNVPLQT